jgi:hypothetical protein
MVGLVHLYKYRQRNAEGCLIGNTFKAFQSHHGEALFVERWVSCIVGVLTSLQNLSFGIKDSPW